MRSKMGWAQLWAVLLVVGLVAPWSRAEAANCALYARAETGVSLYGAAGGWWDEAAGLYQRGHVPEMGAILVFRRSRHMPSGHVAVVAKVVGSREILVDHANWYRGRVTRGMSVIDTSPDNDWTSVSVMDLASGKHGRDNPASGFVYPQTGPHDAGAMRATYASFSPPAAAGEQASNLLHFAVLTDGRHAARHRHGHAHVLAARPAHHHGSRAAHGRAVRTAGGRAAATKHHRA